MRLAETGIILASSSKRRISLLKKAGIRFIVIPHILKKEPSYGREKDGRISSFVKKLALVKAKSLEEKYPDDFIIGSDTLIYFQKNVYGKPSNFEEAFQMIKNLSGKTHRVYTGTSLVNKNGNIYETRHDVSTVKIKPLTDLQIKEYIRKHPPYDKAGGYGIQDKYSIVESYDGSFENVLGLCIQKLVPLLCKYGLFISASPDGKRKNERK